jgi:hypothetical protein
MAAEQLAGLVRTVARPQNLRFILKKVSICDEKNEWVANKVIGSYRHREMLSIHEKKLQEQNSYTKINLKYLSAKLCFGE